MGYCRRCECGAYLDPEEVCDCKKEAAPVGSEPVAAWEYPSTPKIADFGGNVIVSLQ